MVSFPNAKINIGLNVVSKREDGYHNIETVFYPVAWSDILEIIPVKDKTAFSSSGLDVPGKQESNLCLKAYFMLKEIFQLPDVRMHLHKIIPMGAGLGGGSADGAFVINMLNDLFKLGLTESRMMELAIRLGSDCPFFIFNKPAFASGRGDEIIPANVSLKGYYLVIVKPPVHVATADAFNRIRPSKPEKKLSELIQLPVEKWKGALENEFEKTVFEKFPAIKQLKSNLYEQGAIYASMSGSGSAVYGIFQQKIILEPLPAGTVSWQDLLD